MENNIKLFLSVQIVQKTIFKYIQVGLIRSDKEMKVLILHHELGVSLRYVIIRGKGKSKKMYFHDFFYFKSTKRLKSIEFILFYWELDLLKQYFSIYNP